LVAAIYFQHGAVALWLQVGPAYIVDLVHDPLCRSARYGK